MSESNVDDLTRFAIKHGTDKFGLHFYTPVYDRLFSYLRDLPIKLLEIGVGGYGHTNVGGASLGMWADYFAEGEITAVDIAEKNLDFGPRVKIYRGSQDDAVFLAKVNAERGPFDIIIDDGSHVPQHVAASLNHLFPLLKEGGWYVIEDTQTAYWPAFGGDADGSHTMQIARSIIEWLHHAEIKVAQPNYVVPPPATQIRSMQVFHNIIAIEKGDNTEPSNVAYNANNRHAKRAIGIMEEEMERSATPEGLANLAIVYLTGGRLDRAEEVIHKGLDSWPQNPTVLSAARDLARKQGRHAQEVDYLERLLALDPGRSELVQKLEKAKEALRTSS